MIPIIQPHNIIHHIIHRLNISKRGMPILISKSWNQDAADTGRAQIDFTSMMLHLRLDFGYLLSKLECPSWDIIMYNFHGIKHDMIFAVNGVSISTLV